MSQHSPEHVIAVVGMAGRFPGAGSVDQLWDNLAHGRETISRFSLDELRDAGVPERLLRHPDYVPAKGVVDDADRFDAALFGYAPREAKRLDPQVRLLHTCAWEALEDAGVAPRSHEQRIGLYVGVNDNTAWLRRLEASLGTGDPDSFLFSHRDYAATRVAHTLRLDGPAMTVLSACSTSLVAVHLACRALLDDECDLAIAGGVSLSDPAATGYVHQEGLMQSSDGHCRTFDAGADGTVFGDGAGLLVLQRGDRAAAARAPTRAILLGSAVNNDGGRKRGFTAPSVDGQTEVVRAALRRAGVSAESIGYVEAHGTATRVGDPIELRALERAFASRRTGSCAVGSLKTNLGHINVAAGAAALIKVVLALEHRAIPPHLHFEQPNPALELERGPFFVPTSLLDWERREAPRRAAVSAFGFGGTNAHLVVQEAPERTAGGSARGPALLAVSANSEESLRRSTRRLQEFLRERGRILEGRSDEARVADLADVAFTLATGREPLPHRTTVIADSHADARRALASSRSARAAGRPRVVFLFPGQGTQWPGMGGDLYEHDPLVRRVIDRCARGLEPILGADLRDVIFNGSAERLRETRWAQPAVFTVSYALARRWMDWGIRPDLLLGHSLGEITAAAVAGVFELEDALRLVGGRAVLMQGLEPGTMLAVAAVADDLPPMPPGVELAALNAPSSCVVSGPTPAVDAYDEVLRRRRIASRRLATSHAFHSAMVEPILPALAALVAELPGGSARFPVVSSVTGDVVDAERLGSADHWLANCRAPVRFVDAVQAASRGAGDGPTLEPSDPDAPPRPTVLLEVGPGRTLGAMARPRGRSPRHVTTVASLVRADPAESGARPADESGQLHRALAQLWEAGGSPDWRQVFAGQDRAVVRLPTYAFEDRAFALPEAPSAAAPGSWDQLRKLPRLDDWLHVPSWRRTPPPRVDPAAVVSAPWLLLLDRDPLGEALLAELESHGVDPYVAFPGEHFSHDGARRFRLRPEALEDHVRLLDTLAARGVTAMRIVYLWPLESAVARLGEDPGRPDTDDVDRGLVRTFFGLLCLAQALGASSARDDLPITVATRGAHDVSRGEPTDPIQSVVGGPVRVISQEYAHLDCLQVDLDPEGEAGNAADARRLVAETLAHRGEVLVAHRSGTRWSRSYAPLPLEEHAEAPAGIRRGGTYLIVGGLGGLGLAFAAAIAEQGAANLILTGRSAFPPRQRWESAATHADPELAAKVTAVLGLQEHGARVFVVRADVADGEQMAAALEPVVAETGPVHGVIHAAGLPGEGIIQLKDPAGAASILAPKVHGTLVLDRLFATQELDFMVLCSSIAAVLGGIGLVDYSAANHFLDAYANGVHGRPWRRVVSIDWDMWGDVGMGRRTVMPEELRGWLARELADGLTTEEGVAVLGRILTCTDERQVVVSTRDLAARIDLWVRRKPVRERERALEDSVSEPRFERPPLSSEYEPPRTYAEEQVAAVWAGLFEIERVGRNDNFYELGGHSLLAAVMLTSLGKRFDVSIPISAVTDHATVAQLADLVDARRGADNGHRADDDATGSGGPGSEAVIAAEREGTPS